MRCALTLWHSHEYLLILVAPGLFRIDRDGCDVMIDGRN